MKGTKEVSAQKQTSLIVGNNYPALDGLRGIAILLVLWFHAAGFAFQANHETMTNPQLIYYSFAFFGSTGVDLFFVLSGFLITGILIDTANNKDKYKNFYIRRSLRIFPLYYTVLIAFTVYIIFRAEWSGGELGTFFQHMFYLQNWSLQHNNNSFEVLNHTWSLAVEEQFYMVWPVLFWAAYKRSFKHAIIMCVALIALCWVIRYITLEFDQYKLAMTMTFARMDGLIAGALLSILLRHYKHKINAELVLMVTCCIGAVLMFLYTLASFKMTAHIFVLGHGFTLSVLMYCGIIAYLFTAQNKGSLSRALSYKPLVNIGKISYGLYIYHHGVMFLVRDMLVDNELSYWSDMLIVLIIGSALSYAIAYLSYHLYEKKFLILKDKYAPHDAG